ncbi:MAG: hypothetical protein ACR2GA_03760 [Chloroflexota bacterium]
MEETEAGSATGDELLSRQNALQVEAHRVLNELDVMAVLSRMGQTSIVGSLALGLMVWRDIDIEVQCERLNSDLAFQAVRPLISHSGVYRLTYHDWTGSRATPDWPEGYYWGVRYQPLASEEWKLDIWLLPAGTVRRTGGALIESLTASLTDESRSAILQLKDIWRHLPTYRDTVLSTDIYDAVLNHGIRTADDFDRYLTERGKSSR